MAVAKLGAIVTGLAGSIGGTTFRRNRSNLVVGNKPRGRSRSAALVNPALGKFSANIAAWAGLTPTVRSQWAAAAAIYQFPDRFGSLKYLTPRQLFLKLNADVMSLGLPFHDPTTLDSTPTGVIFTEATLFVYPFNEWTIRLQGTQTAPWRIKVQLQKVSSFIAAPVFNSRKSVYSPSPGYIMGNPFDFTFDPTPMEWPISFEVGEKVIGYFTPVNQSGFQGTPTALELTAVAG